MRVIFVIAALVTTVVGAPAQSDRDVVVVKDFPLVNIGVDDYNFGFELSDGQARREYGQLKNIGTKNEALFVEGSFSYIDPVTKELYFTTYYADETGYHPKASHIHL